MAMEAKPSWEDWIWQRASFLAARDEPAHYARAALTPDVLDALASRSPQRIDADVSRLMAEQWLQALQAGDWSAGEAFKLRWDLWEHLADVQGVTLPEPDSAWSATNPPSHATVERRLRQLGIQRQGAGGRRRGAGRKSKPQPTP